jgi:MFS family permease
MDTQPISSTLPAARPATRAGLVIVYVILFLEMMGGSLLLPILPYVLRQYNPDALAIGMLTAIHAAAAFGAAPVLGLLSDRWGRRPVLLLCVLGSAISYLVFGLAGALWVLFVSRLIDGLTGGSIATGMAYLADVTDPRERTKYFAFSGMAFGLGFILGPVLAGGLSTVSLAAPAYAAGALSLAAALAGFFFLPESLPPEKRTRDRFHWAQANPFGVMAGIARLPNLGLLLSGIFLVYLAFSGMFGYFAVFTLDRFSATPLDNAILFAVVGLVQMVGQGGIVYRLTPRFGEKTVALLGLLLQAASYLPFLFVPSFAWLYPLALGGALGNAFCRPTLEALVANSVAPHEQGRAAGTTAGLYSLTNVIGPLLAGLAYDGIAPAAPFLGGALLLAAAALLIGRVRK